MFRRLNESGETAYGFTVTGDLTTADIAAICRQIDFAIDERRKPIGILADLTGMLGSSWAARWDEMRFLQQHTAHISRMAVVSDNRWEEVAEMIVIATAVLQAETLYFHSSEMIQAWRWAKMTKFDEREPVRIMYPGTGLFKNYTPEYTEL